MPKKKPFIHPYIPNSVPHVQREMLTAIGVESIDDLYEDIPPELRFQGEMKLPPPFLSEQDLKRHVMSLLQKNISCEEYACFLGGGSAYHYVPAIVDEIVHRSEFLTAYAGEPYEDKGRFQALFEYQSLMGELLDFDVVNVPTYDWSQAASTAIRMAGRITKRPKVVLAGPIAPDRLAVIRNYCQPVMEVALSGYDPTTGLLALEELQSQLSSDVAAVYFENPSYFGTIDHRGQEIADLAHAQGALCVVGVDPLSLGLLKPPSQYGADIACGDIQPLGNHMYFGGALGGFIATRDEEKFVMEYPSRLFGISRTAVEGEWGFGDVAYSRTSFDKREKGKEFVGTAAALYGIAAAVFLSLLGPQGLKELSQHILQKAQFTAQKLAGIPGVKICFSAPNFKEFVVDFKETGKTVAEINQALLRQKIFGGKDLSGDFPELSGCALFCVTEMITLEQIKKLRQALSEIVG